MKLQELEEKIVVEFDDEKFKYSRDEWGEKQNYMNDGEVYTIEEWKIDLVRNHGVDLDEL